MVISVAFLFCIYLFFFAPSGKVWLTRSSFVYRLFILPLRRNGFISILNDFHILLVRSRRAGEKASFFQILNRYLTHFFFSLKTLSNRQLFKGGKTFNKQSFALFWHPKGIFFRNQHQAQQMDSKNENKNWLAVHDLPSPPLPPFQPSQFPQLFFKKKHANQSR